MKNKIKWYLIIVPILSFHIVAFGQGGFCEIENDQITVEDSEINIEVSEAFGVEESEVATIAELGDDIAISSSEFMGGFEAVTFSEVLGPIGMAFQVIVIADLLNDMVDWNELKETIDDQACLGESSSSYDPFNQAQAECERIVRRTVTVAHKITQACHYFMEYVVVKPANWIRAHALKQYHLISGTGKPNRVLREGHYHDMNVKLSKGYTTNLKHLIPRDHRSEADWTVVTFNEADKAHYASWKLPFIETNKVIYIEDYEATAGSFSTALVVNAEETDAEAIRNYLTYNGNSELVDQTVSFPYSSDISAAFTTFSKISGDDMTFEMSHSIPATQIKLVTGVLVYKVLSNTNWKFVFNNHTKQNTHSESTTHGYAEIVKSPYESEIKFAIIEFDENQNMNILEDEITYTATNMEGSDESSRIAVGINDIDVSAWAGRNIYLGMYTQIYDPSIPSGKNIPLINQFLSYGAIVDLQPSTSGNPNSEYRYNETPKISLLTSDTVEDIDLTQYETNILGKNNLKIEFDNNAANKTFRSITFENLSNPSMGQVVFEWDYLSDENTFQGITNWVTIDTNMVLPTYHISDNILDKVVISGDAVLASPSKEEYIIYNAPFSPGDLLLSKTIFDDGSMVRSSCQIPYSNEIDRGIYTISFDEIAMSSEQSSAYDKWMIEPQLGTNAYIIMNTETELVLGLGYDSVNTETDFKYGDLSQLWTLEPAADGGVYIVNIENAGYLNYDSGLILSYESDQSAFINYIEAADPIPEFSESFLLHNTLYTDKYLSVDKEIEGDVANLEPEGIDHQAWSLDYIGANQFALYNDFSEKYLTIDVTDLSALKQYALYNIAETYTQHIGFYVDFIIEEESSGYFRFKDPRSKGFLKVNAEDLANKIPVSIGEDEDVSLSKWGVEELLQEPSIPTNLRQGGLRYTARINESGSGERIYSGIHDMATMMDVKVSEGYIYIAQDGWYGFQQGGPSTMKLSINGQVIFNQNGSNDIGYNDQMNWLALKAGYHTIEVIKNNTNYEGGLLWQPLHGEIANIPSEVLYYKTDFIGETGTILGEQDAAESFEYTIEYLGDYTDPVVILSANTTGGIGDPITLKVDTETNSDSFTVQLAEWSYLDKIHVLESIDYMVVEAGYYTDFMGYQGVNLLAKNEWVSGKENIITEVNLWDENDSDIFTSTPLVLHQPQTANGTDPFISRIFNVSNSRLEVILQKEAANRDTNPGQPNEKIGFVALDTGTQSDYREAAFIAENQIVLNDDWTELNMASVLDAYGDGNKVVLMHTQTMEHDLRTYPAGTVQGRNLDGTSYDGEIYYQQEASQGSTMVTGLYETLGFVAFGNHQLLSASQQWDIDDATDITGTTYLLGDSYWTMQDGQDRISQVDGTAYNGAQFSNSGLLSLDGDAYVNLGYHHNVTKDFTIKAKFSYNTTSTVQTIIAKNNGSPHEVQYALCIDEDGRMLFEYNRANNGFALHGKTQLESYQTNNSAWHEVELRVHDDLTIELIVNDVLEDIAVAPAETIPTTAILFIGKTGGNFHSRFFGGQIDFISFEHSTPAKFGEIYYWDMFTYMVMISLGMWYRVMEMP